MIPPPLEGIRVIDLTRNWAGPSCTAFLADLGADVIKVEAPGGDPQRGARRIESGDARPSAYNRAAIFNQINRNKRSFALDLQTDRGAEVFRKLAAVSHVVVENFRVGVMDRLSIGYDYLSEENPGIVMVSISGFGQTGPWRDYIGYGVAIEPLMGLFSVTGYEGGGPMRSGVDHPDPMAGLHAAGAALAALYRRKRTGEGCHIDVSMLESGSTVMGMALLACQAAGQAPIRHGNRGEAFAPRGSYRCNGEDEWLAVCVRTDAEWQALAGAIGRPDLATDPSLACLSGRQARADEIDEAISTWTAGLDKLEAMRFLQEAGVPAGAVLDISEVVSNEHFAARQLVARIPHPEGGDVPQLGPRFRIDNTTERRQVMAPFANDNDYVLKELLGLPEKEIESLYVSRVVTRLPL